jgi:hypothetical protein
MRRWTVILASLAVSTAARAQLVESTIPPAGDLNWSMTAGRTIGYGNSALGVEVGWPGINFNYLHGFDERTDWGFHVGLNYGLQGTDQTLAGLNIGIPYRHTLGTIGDTAFAFEATPGIFIYSNGGALVGFGGPMGVIAAFKLDPRLTFDIGAEIPILLSVSNPAGFLFGPQFGLGGEFLLDRNLAVTARFRVGPMFSLNTADTNTATGFTALIGLAFNLR